MKFNKKESQSRKDLNLNLKHDYDINNKSTIANANSLLDKMNDSYLDNTHKQRSPINTSSNTRNNYPNYKLKDVPTKISVMAINLPKKENGGMDDNNTNRREISPNTIQIKKPNDASSPISTISTVSNGNTQSRNRSLHNKIDLGGGVGQSGKTVNLATIKKPSNDKMMNVSVRDKPSTDRMDRLNRTLKEKDVKNEKPKFNLDYDTKEKTISDIVGYKKYKNDIETIIHIKDKEIKEIIIPYLFYLL